MTGISTRGSREFVAKIAQLSGMPGGARALEVLTAAAEKLAADVRSKMRSARWPAELQDNIFIRAKGIPEQSGLTSALKSKRSKMSVLVGIGKRGKSKPWLPGYREWTAVPYGKSAGKLIGESVATMLELGIGNRPVGRMQAGYAPVVIAPRPVWRPSLTNAKRVLPGEIRSGMQEIVHDIARAS